MKVVLSATRRSSGQSPIAIDASALVEVLLQTPAGDKIRRLVAEAQLIAPDVINPEVMQSLRKLERSGRLSGARATRAIAALARSPVRRIPTAGLIDGAWSLRANVSAYDACYVALARALDCPLLTTDAPLRRAPSLGVTFLTVA